MANRDTRLWAHFNSEPFLFSPLLFLYCQLATRDGIAKQSLSKQYPCYLYLNSSVYVALQTTSLGPLTKDFPLNFFALAASVCLVDIHSRLYFMPVVMGPHLVQGLSLRKELQTIWTQYLRNGSVSKKENSYWTSMSLPCGFCRMMIETW